jgi:RNA polymerase sigma-70 factor (ECF subfamily)
MERVRRGDAGAFETLYDEYHRLVYGVALRVLADAPGAEDVAQSVFLKLWSNPASFVSGNFGAWIVRVARNRAFDALRARAAARRGPRSAGRARLARRDGAGGIERRIGS